MINSHVKKVLIFVPIFIIVLFIYSPKVFGKEDSMILKKEMINPGTPFYIFKRIWEKSLIFVLFPSQIKINYEINILETRLSELNDIVKSKNLNEFQQASERFSYQAGILVDQVINSNYPDKQKIKEKFTQYTKLLEELRDLNPANSSYWLLIQQNIDTLKILTDRLPRK